MRNEKKIHVWITQNALSKGIVEHDARLSSHSHLDTVEILTPGGFVAWFCIKPNWHTSREEAVAHAEVMRLKKIKSLEKQLARLRALKFS